jgi:hypothetical protein
MPSIESVERIARTLRNECIVRKYLGHCLSISFPLQLGYSGMQLRWHRWRSRGAKISRKRVVPSLICASFADLLGAMNLLDLTPQQLKRAAAIKEKIQDLSKELSQILGEPTKAKTATPGRKRLSVTARKNIAAAQQARWAKFRAVKKSAAASARKTKNKTMSSATKSKLSAKMKAYWAAKRSRKK